jgi:hypothetical protein
MIIAGHSRRRLDDDLLSSQSGKDGASTTGRGGRVRDIIEAGNILIREGSSLPEGLGIEIEPCVAGWGIVKDLDGYGMDRKVRKSGWTFFYLARGIKATVFGINKEKMVRRAIQNILANPKSEKFNSLEITRVASASSLFGYSTVSAHSRHIQESMFLSQPKDFQTLGRKSPSASQGTMAEQQSKYPLNVSLKES